MKQPIFKPYIFLPMVLACLVVGSFVWLSASFPRPTQAEQSQAPDAPTPIAIYDVNHPLRDLATEHGLLFGTVDDNLGTQLYQNTVTQEFSSVTSGNKFKFENVHPCPPNWLLIGDPTDPVNFPPNASVHDWVLQHGLIDNDPTDPRSCDLNPEGTLDGNEYYWADADAFVQWANTAMPEGLQIFIHTLIYRTQNRWADYNFPRDPNNPPEDVSVELTPQQIYRLMKEHIRAVIGQYCQYSNVYGFDVVNEAIVWDQDPEPPDLPYIYRGFWQGVNYGQHAAVEIDFIHEAFTLAREALEDPVLNCHSDIQLFYNEQGAEYVGDAQTEAVYAYFTFLKETLPVTETLPMDGIGFQAHLAWVVDPASPPEQQHNWLNLLGNMNRFTRDFGLEVKITELDVRIYDDWVDPTPEGQGTPDPDLPDYYGGQARIFAGVVAACVHADHCTGITVWGTEDGASWFNYPPFNRDLDPMLFWDKDELIWDTVLQTCTLPAVLLVGIVLDGETETPLPSVQINLLGEYSTPSGLRTTLLDATPTGADGGYTFALPNLPAPPSGSSGWTRLLLQVSPPSGTFASAATAPPPGYSIDEATLAYPWPALTPGVSFTGNNFTLLSGHRFTGQVTHNTQPVAEVLVHLEAEYALASGGYGLVPLPTLSLPTDVAGNYALTLLTSTRASLALPPDGTAWTGVRVVVGPPSGYVAASAQVSPPGTVASPAVIAYSWNTPGGLYPENHFTLAQTFTFEGQITNPAGWSYPAVQVALSAEYVRKGTLHGSLEIAATLPPPPPSETSSNPAYTFYVYNAQGALVQTLSLPAVYEPVYTYTLALAPGSYQVYARLITPLNQIYYSPVVPLAVSSDIATAQNFFATQTTPPDVSGNPNLPVFTLAFGRVPLDTAQSDLNGNYSLMGAVSELSSAALPADGVYWTRLLLLESPPVGTLPHAAGPATSPGWASGPTQIEYPVGLPYAHYGQNHFQLYTPPPTQPPAEFQGRVVNQGGAGVSGVALTLSAEFLQAGFVLGQLSLAPPQGSVIQSYALALYHANGTLIKQVEAQTAQQPLPYLHQLAPGAYQAYLKVTTSEGIFYSARQVFTVSSGQNTQLDLTASLPSAPAMLPLNPMPQFTLAYAVLPIASTTSDSDGNFTLVVESVAWPLLPPTAVSWTALYLTETVPAGKIALSASVPPPGYVVHANTLAYPWGLGGSAQEEAQTIWTWGGQGKNGDLFPENSFVLDSALTTLTPTATAPSSTVTPIPPVPQVHLAFVHPLADGQILSASQTAFQAEAWDTLMGDADGDGVQSVIFQLYHPNGTLLYSHEDTASPYCVWQTNANLCEASASLAPEEGPTVWWRKPGILKNRLLPCWNGPSSSFCPPLPPYRLRRSPLRPRLSLKAQAIARHSSIVQSPPMASSTPSSLTFNPACICLGLEITLLRPRRACLPTHLPPLPARRPPCPRIRRDRGCTLTDPICPSSPPPTLSKV